MSARARHAGAWPDRGRATCWRRSTAADLANAAFPWLSARTIEIGSARVMALRISYVGELGFELHAPVETLAPIYDALFAAGAAHGIRDFGIYAMDSLRLEKGYPAWKIDLTLEETPLAASLERFVDLGKPEFVGRVALLRSARRARRAPGAADGRDRVEAPARQRLKDGAIGRARQLWGIRHTAATEPGVRLRPLELARPGTRARDRIFGELRAATVATEPPYDPREFAPARLILPLTSPGSPRVSAVRLEAAGIDRSTSHIRPAARPARERPRAPAPRRGCGAPG